MASKDRHFAPHSHFTVITHPKAQTAKPETVEQHEGILFFFFFFIGLRSALRTRRESTLFCMKAYPPMRIHHRVPWGNVYMYKL
jgi:hypothetical protein